MITPPADPRAAARPAGLIDTLWSGFDLIHRHAWLLVLPIIVDVFMWLGPQISVAPVVDAWAASAGVSTSGDEVIGRAMDEARGSAIELIRGSDAIKRYNLVSLVAVPVIGIPSFRAGVPGEGPVLHLRSEGVTTAAVIAIGALGLALAALFYGLVGHVVREGRLQPRRYLADAPAITGAVFALFGLLLLVALGVGVPLGALLAILNTVSPMVTGIVGPIIAGVLLWGFIYLFFTTDALFVTRSRPVSAVQNSILVVRANFWSTLGFIALILVISGGFPYIWDQLATNLRTPGIVLGIVGHNYISSVLAAASMTYYKERFERMIASHEGSNAPVAPARG
jgi:hypothetical protein